tara:strand:- start:155511 stop:157559 length:2049 start_codon:yes stop_codon:yes gene_type:complete
MKSFSGAILMSFFNTKFYLVNLLASIFLFGHASAACQSAESTANKVPITIQDLRSVETQTKRVYKRITSATVSIRSGYGSGSGAIIREDGLILTAAHVAGVPDEHLMITMANGQVLPARVLGCDHEKDIALAIITEGGKYPFVELAEASISGQWCLALGHPGGLQSDRSSLLRVSRVHEGDSSLGVHSSASLISGDSGGPLFDLEGRLIGVHKAISALEGESSFHVSVENVHDRFDELLARQEFGQSIMNQLSSIATTSSIEITPDPTSHIESQATTHVVKDISELPPNIREMIQSGESKVIVKSNKTESSQETDEVSNSQSSQVIKFSIDPSDPKQAREILKERLESMGIDGAVTIMGLGDESVVKPDQDLFEVVQPISSSFSSSIVRLYSDGDPVAIGVVVDQDGLIVSKASELFGLLTVQIDDVHYDATVLVTDEPNDLALIRIHASQLTPIKWDQADTPSVGSFVFAPGSSDLLGFGTLSHQAIPQRQNKDYSFTDLLGIELERMKSLTQIKDVDEGGPAHQVGIERGDIIIAVNRVPVSNAASMAITLQNRTPGTEVVLSCLRPDGHVLHSKILMSADHLESSRSGQSSRDTLRVVSQMVSPVSDRSQDFPLVFLHDTPINASDCGGPLIDLDGRAIGLNIARIDRTSTAAIPARQVVQAIQNLLDRGQKLIDENEN